MRKRQRTIAAAGLAATGLILVSGTLVAGAQKGDSAKGQANPPAVAQRDTKKPDTAAQQKLRTELSDLLKQRADLDRRIAETRGKLGETGGTHRRFEFRNGDGPPQVFEFDGDGNGNLPPEARKQIEEAQKRMHDVFGSLPMENFPQFDFQFDGSLGPNGAPDRKAFQERMQKWSQEFRDRMQRRSNGTPGRAPEKPQEGKSDKPTANKPKTYDI